MRRGRHYSLLGAACASKFLGTVRALVRPQPEVNDRTEGGTERTEYDQQVPFESVWPIPLMRAYLFSG